MIATRNKHFRSMLHPPALVLGLIGLSLSGHARLPAQAAPGWKATLDSTVRAELRATETPGAVVVIVRNDSVVYASGFGVVSVETNQSMTPDVLFRIASTTKMLTAAAVLSAVDRGIVSLDAPVGTYMAGLTESIARLTLRDLLTHQAGLRDSSSYFGPDDEAALDSFVRSWGDNMVLGPPKDVYSYSNLGYALAGAVIAQARKRSYADVMADDLFQPLGMTRTTLRPTMAMTYPLSQGHDLTGSPPTLTVVRPFSNDVRFWPAGSVFTSGNDFARFVRAVLNDGRVDGKQVLPRSVARSLLTRQTNVPALTPGEDAGYSFGLVERTLGGLRVMQHGGVRIGFGTVVRLVPERHLGIIVLANRTNAVLPQTLQRATAVFAPDVTFSPPAALKTFQIDSAEAAAAAGHYVNMAGELELTLVAVGNRLELRSPGTTTGAAVTKIGPGQYRAGGQAFALVSGRITGARYLHIAGHALRRVER